MTKRDDTRHRSTQLEVVLRMQMTVHISSKAKGGGGADKEVSEPAVDLKNNNKAAEAKSVKDCRTNDTASSSECPRTVGCRRLEAVVSPFHASTRHLLLTTVGHQVIVWTVTLPDTMWPFFKISFNCRLLPPLFQNHILLQGPNPPSAQPLQPVTLAAQITSLPDGLN